MKRTVFGIILMVAFVGVAARVTTRSRQQLSDFVMDYEEVHLDEGEKLPVCCPLCAAYAWQQGEFRIMPINVVSVCTECSILVNILLVSYLE